MLGYAVMLDPVAPVYSSACIYSTSANLTIAYNMGVLSLVFYAMQVGSGVLMAMAYNASTDHAFIVLDG